MLRLLLQPNRVALGKFYLNLPPIGSDGVIAGFSCRGSRSDRTCRRRTLRRCYPQGGHQWSIAGACTIVSAEANTMTVCDLENLSRDVVIGLLSRLWSRSVRQREALLGRMRESQH